MVDSVNKRFLKNKTQMLFEYFSESIIIFITAAQKDKITTFLCNDFLL